MPNLDPAKVFASAASVGSQSAQALFKMNAMLVSQGYPMYYCGGLDFDTLYRLYPTPRYLFRWRPPWLLCEQIYLSYRPGTAEQVDFVYIDSANTLTSSRLNA